MNEKIGARGGEEIKFAVGCEIGSDQFILTQQCLLPISLNEVKVCSRGKQGQSTHSHVYLNLQELADLFCIEVLSCAKQLPTPCPKTQFLE